MIYKNEQTILEEITYHKGQEELPLLEYKLLQQIPGIRHCFTTRQGGVSQGIFSSMNLSYTRGDEPEDVTENYRRIAQVFGKGLEDIVTSDQTHTTNVRVVTREDWGKGIIRDRDYTDVDGLITQESGLILATFYADCVPLYFVDPIHKAIGLSHSGWRGTVGRIGAKTIEKMQEVFGSSAEDMYCAIGPSICQDCYEVSEDVAEAFMEEFSDKRTIEKHEKIENNVNRNSGILLDHILYDKGNGKYQLDLWKANERILLEAGIMPEHLAVTNLCTCCNPQQLFSHRASHGRRGNLGAFLMLKDC